MDDMVQELHNWSTAKYMNKQNNCLEK